MEYHCLDALRRRIGHELPPSTRARILRRLFGLRIAEWLLGEGDHWWTIPDDESQLEKQVIDVTRVALKPALAWFDTTDRISKFESARAEMQKTSRRVTPPPTPPAPL